VWLRHAPGYTSLIPKIRIKPHVEFLFDTASEIATGKFRTRSLGQTKRQIKKSHEAINLGMAHTKELGGCLQKVIGSRTGSAIFAGICGNSGKRRCLYPLNRSPGPTSVGENSYFRPVSNFHEGNDWSRLAALVCRLHGRNVPQKKERSVTNAATERKTEFLRASSR
jgi:hypothetical protein